MGLDLYGTDVTDETEFVRRISDGRIPFEDNSFDLVISNQVFEHVHRLEPVLREISRVLKNDGLLVCLFPTSEVVREAHCGVPFLHWLPKGFAPRVSYAELWSGLGFSFHKESVSRRKWATDAVEWMDQFVFYRRRSEALMSFKRVFAIESIEEHYLAFRYPKVAPFLRIPWFREAARLVCRRFNGVALTARKPS